MISGFFGEYRWLSNFWEVPIMFDGVSYRSVEAAYQAAKTLDVKEREKFVNVDAKTAKRLGRRATLRADWNDVKVGIMKELVRCKFKDLKLRKMLIDTNNHELIESNTWGDVFWGVCNNRGYNHLGIILMEVRKELVDNIPNKEFKVIVAGSREFNNYEYLKKKLDYLLEDKAKECKVFIISGTARGADQLGERYAKESGYSVISMPADWDRFGKSAGYRRNEAMAEVADAAAIFWDGKSPGSMHMYNIAKEKGLSVRLIEYNKGEDR